MPTYTVCKLIPRAPFHFGERGVGLEETNVFLHSDTLFSAICHGWRMLYGADSLTQGLLDRFREANEPFLISAAFPYAGDVLFLPKPLMPSKNSKSVKKIKRVKFVSEEIFRSVIAGEEIGTLLTEENLIGGGKICVKPEEKSLLPKSDGSDVFWKVSERPRVTVDRSSSASVIYHFGEVTFAQNCGLYFLIDFKDNSFKAKLRAVLRFMGDEGLGGDRSSGYGLFDLSEFTDLSLPNQPANKFVTLSCCCPDSAEELASVISNYASYELMTRRGWVYSPDITNLRRRTVSMFAEGSILGSTNFPVGSLVDVTPQNVKCPHKVFRYGYAFPVAMT